MTGMERSEAPAWRLTGVNTCGVSSTAEGGAEGKRGEEQEGRGGSDSTEGYCGRGHWGEYEFEVRERGERREGGDRFQGGHFGGALEPVAVDADRGETRYLLGLERVELIQLPVNRRKQNDLDDVDDCVRVHKYNLVDSVAVQVIDERRGVKLEVSQILRPSLKRIAVL